MTRPASLLPAPGLATALACLSLSAMGADGVGTRQELTSVRSSGHVLSASWTRLPDSYSLQVVIDRSMPPVDIAAALKALPQQGVRATPYPIPIRPDETPANPDRASMFIANTIASLRDTNFGVCGRTLTLDDGRRTLPGREPEAPVPVPPPPGYSDQRVQVWLLNADGSRIQATSYNCDDPGRNGSGRTDFPIWYGYSLEDGARAVAVAIRIGGDYFIEKLQPLAAPAESR